MAPLEKKGQLRLSLRYQPREVMAPKKSILRWELGGIAFIVVLGSVLHLAFEWCVRSIPLAPIALAVLAVLFVVFTFHPPQLSLFRDSVTGGYGIVG